MNVGDKIYLRCDIFFFVVLLFRVSHLVVLKKHGRFNTSPKIVITNLLVSSEKLCMLHDDSLLFIFLFDFDFERVAEGKSAVPTKT